MSRIEIGPPKLFFRVHPKWKVTGRILKPGPQSKYHLISKDIIGEIPLAETVEFRLYDWHPGRNLGNERGYGVWPIGEDVEGYGGDIERIAAQCAERFWTRFEYDVYTDSHTIHALRDPETILDTDRRADCAAWEDDDNTSGCFYIDSGDPWKVLRAAYGSRVIASLNHPAVAEAVAEEARYAAQRTTFRADVT